MNCFSRMRRSLSAEDWKATLGEANRTSGPGASGTKEWGPEVPRV